MKMKSCRNSGVDCDACYHFGTHNKVAECEDKGHCSECYERCHHNNRKSHCPECKLEQKNKKLLAENKQIRFERDEANLRLIKSAVCLNNPCYDLMQKGNKKCKYWDDCASNNWMKICGPVPPGFRPEGKE